MKRTTSVLEWPDELFGLQWLPSFWGELHVQFAPMFAAPPDLLVVHSASLANWVGEYLQNPRAKVPEPNEIRADGVRASDGRRLVDGHWYRVAAAHLCWYSGQAHKLAQSVKVPKHPNTFVQQASLRRSVPGAGGSICQGKGGVNRRAYHVELPARPENPEQVRRLFRTMIISLCETIPSVRYWTTHKAIDLNKHDPVKGSGFTDAWMAGLGLEFAPRR